MFSCPLSMWMVEKLTPYCNRPGRYYPLFNETEDEPNQDLYEVYLRLHDLPWMKDYHYFDKNPRIPTLAYEYEVPYIDTEVYVEMPCGFAEPEKANIFTKSLPTADFRHDRMLTCGW